MKKCAFDPLPARHPLAPQAARLRQKHGVNEAVDLELDDLCQAMAQMYRFAMESRFAGVVKKQHAVVDRINALLAASKPRYAPDAVEVAKGQPYVSALVKSFRPSVRVLPAAARAVGLPPSVIALSAETLLHLHGGKAPALTMKGHASPAAVYRGMTKAFSDSLRTDAAALHVPWSMPEEPSDVDGAFPDQVGASVAVFRGKRKLSQPDLLSLCKDDGERQDSGSCISQIENARHSPSWPRIFELLRAMNIRLSELFFQAEIFSQSQPQVLVGEKILAIVKALQSRIPTLGMAPLNPEELAQVDELKAFFGKYIGMLKPA